MVRRVILLLSAAAVGWYLVARLRRPSEDEFAFEDDGFAPAETDDGPAGAMDSAATGAVAATGRDVPAPVDRIRSIVGEEPPEAAPTAAAAGSDEAEAGHVKGNVRSDGEKIYHLPGDPAYDRTNAEQTFHSIEEAEAAGFRRAGQT